MKKRNPPRVAEDSAACTSSSSDGGGESDVMPANEGSVKVTKKNPNSDLLMRTIFTFVMVIIFLVTQYVGQTLGILLVVICQVLMFKEIMKINRKRALENELPGFHTLPWFMFIVCNGFTVIQALHMPLVSTWPMLDDWLKHTTFVAFSLYMTGFIAFVLSLKPIKLLDTIGSKLKRNSSAPIKQPKQKFFRYQFNQFGWLHMGLLAFSVMSSFFFSTMLDGMIWFTLPISCVVHNDSWAFACGRFFGKVPLIPTLSPKKTWEGFIGAWFFTTLWAVWFAGFLAKQKRFVCPKVHFLTPIDCEVSPTFIEQAYDVPFMFVALLGEQIWLRPVQLHAIAFAAFASLGAPFGGFFASGLKRAFNLKDFGDLIPGHGGMIDRMDCQILTSLFVYVYVSNFVTEHGGVCSAWSTYSSFNYCLSRMPLGQQVDFYNTLGAQLRESGIVITDGIASVAVN